MYQAKMMHGWGELVGSLALFGIVLTALSLMLGILKRPEALKYIVAILGIFIVLLLLPCAFRNLWSAISLWQWIGLAAIVIFVGHWRRPRRRRQEREAR
jgi:hypothetical protein